MPRWQRWRLRYADQVSQKQIDSSRTVIPELRWRRASDNRRVHTRRNKVLRKPKYRISCSWDGRTLVARLIHPCEMEVDYRYLLGSATFVEEGAHWQITDACRRRLHPPMPRKGDCLGKKSNALGGTRRRRRGRAPVRRGPDQVERKQEGNATAEGDRRGHCKRSEGGRKHQYLEGRMSSTKKAVSTERVGDPAGSE
ncbi:uncharacterized protein ARMOST_20510 [Armillaria ostoyae]|uniref:Uncharacterized protein n=1 Tax=Armillaria ostoyae TaxID=47428 RepID=A0A284S7K0_ARMOS|nr:uncharacterized protein ARMOST_20510 [Armillaria ostoyae]